MKQKILLIALLGAFMALGGSCCKDEEQAKPPTQESKQSPQGIDIVIDFDTTCTTDTMSLD